MQSTISCCNVLLVLGNRLRSSTAAKCRRHLLTFFKLIFFLMLFLSFFAFISFLVISLIRGTNFFRVIKLPRLFQFFLVTSSILGFLQLLRLFHVFWVLISLSSFDFASFFGYCKSREVSSISSSFFGFYSK